MNTRDLNIDETEIENLNAAKKETNFKSSFNFLNAHNGIRQNKIHLLIAPTHSGKSTMVRSILRDVIFNNQNKKILLMLSEETELDFKTDFIQTIPMHRVVSNIAISSELDSNYDASEMMNDLVEHFEFYKYDLVVFDNITTSKLYMDRTNKEQSIISSWFKKLTKKTTLFLIAHTNSSDYNNRLLDENDIRGSRTITNLCEFLYILQPIRINDSLHQFINIVKHRGQNCDGKFFKLNYDKRLFAFNSDYKTDFQSIKDIFKLRNKL